MLSSIPKLLVVGAFAVLVCFGSLSRAEAAIFRDRAAFSWLSQVTVPVPDTLAAAGNLNGSVKVRGVVSDKAPLRIE